MGLSLFVYPSSTLVLGVQVGNLNLLACAHAGGNRVKLYKNDSLEKVSLDSLSNILYYGLMYQKKKYI